MKTTKNKTKKPTLEDLVKFAHAADMRVRIDLVPFEGKKPAAFCMVCRAPIPMKTEFNKATQLGLCDKAECHKVFAEAGIV